ncbi:MAG: alpha/beta hydrolase [Candidatus Spechtbacterales bacterium]
MEKKIKVKGLTTFYRDEGEGDPVLILHGWGSNADAWHTTQKELARQGFRVITIDLPGFWRTEEPPEPWHLKDYSDFVYEFTQKIDLAYFTLAGHSFGGRITIDYATRYPKQLSSIILISAAGVMRHKKAKIGVMLILTKTGNAIFSIPPLSFLKPLAQKVWYKFTGEHDYEKASPIMKSVMQRVLEEELYSYLPNITVPALILWGDKDTATPLSDGFILHKNIPVTHMHVFPDMPHALNLKAPIQVAKEISLFLKKNR